MKSLSKVHYVLTKSVENRKPSSRISGFLFNRLSGRLSFRSLSRFICYPDRFSTRHPVSYLDDFKVSSVRSHKLSRLKISAVVTCARTHAQDDLRRTRCLRVFASNRVLRPYNRGRVQERPLMSKEQKKIIIIYKSPSSVRNARPLGLAAGDETSDAAGPRTINYAYYNIISL